MIRPCGDSWKQQKYNTQPLQKYTLSDVFTTYSITDTVVISLCAHCHILEYDQVYIDIFLWLSLS